MHINLIKPTASYDSTTLNEKGMIPKGKGGIAKTRPMGKKPRVATPFLSP